MSNIQKRILNYNEFQDLLMKRKEEYIQNGSFQKMLQFVDKGIGILLNLVKEEKIRAFVNEIEGKEYTWIEIDNSKIQEEELETLNKMGKFFMDIETKLGYNKQPN